MGTVNCFMWHDDYLLGVVIRRCGILCSHEALVRPTWLCRTAGAHWTCDLRLFSHQLPLERAACCLVGLSSKVNTAMHREAFGGGSRDIMGGQCAKLIS